MAPSKRMQQGPFIVTALADCTLYSPRAFGGAVQVVTAQAVPRAFPTHVSPGLGICLKSGPEHQVAADGRALTYPADALCVRAPGCVWSCEAAPVAFLSIDIAPEYLPQDLRGRTMRCGPPSAALDVHATAQRLLHGDGMDQQSALAELLLAALDAGALEGGHSIQARQPDTHLVRRARERLASALHESLDLDQLCQDIDANKFVLIRQFRRAIGTTPHQYRTLLRLDHARLLLARGTGLAEVAARVGFADQAHLSRSFKRVFGLTPSQYARAVRLSM